MLGSGVHPSTSSHLQHPVGGYFILMLLDEPMAIVGILDANLITRLRYYLSMAGKHVPDHSVRERKYTVLQSVAQFSIDCRTIMVSKRTVS
ncbi:unnamed protein product [Allacma fusca]|uniref:Uncharacterized protein n=1 Tax=Allacma fusca TaxID=39272 RepID=A0A8J2LFE3_9HEXA|nr:unnamed protein product [Allacma fusca]